MAGGSVSESSACSASGCGIGAPGLASETKRTSQALQAELSDTDTQPVTAPTSARPGPVPISHAAASAKAAADGDETPSSDN